MQFANEPYIYPHVYNDTRLMTRVHIFFLYIYIYISMTHLCVLTEAGSNKRTSTYTRVCINVETIETRVFTLARVISKYYRFPREKEPRFCLNGARASACIHVRA